MILRIGSVERAPTPSVQEVEAEMTESFHLVTERVAKLFGYHGRFSVRLPSGAVPPTRQNLQDCEEFAAMVEVGEDTVLPLVQVGIEG